MSSVPCFKNLKGFATITDGKKIESIKFLRASEELVKIIEIFGRVFTPVVKDMQGNINIIKLFYQKDEKKYIYLENLLEFDTERESVENALLWLKRSLDLIFIFFTNILNDKMCSESVKHHLQTAYNKTLKPYHGFLVQTTVSLIFRWLPKRSELLGTGHIQEENIKAMLEYLPNMQLYILKIDEMLNLKIKE